MKFDFLFCSERSGSNLITKLIDSHPEVCGPFPSHLIRIFATNIYKYGDLNIDTNWLTLLEDVVALLNFGIANWEHDFSINELKKNVVNRSQSAIVRFVYEAEATNQNKQRLFIKENHVHVFLPFILTSFNDARFIYMVRDPRDMALTWKENASAAGECREAAAMWKAEQEKYIEIYGYLRQTDRILLITFEELVKSTTRTLKEVCSFLGLDYTNQMLEFNKNELVIKNAQKLSSWSKLKNPIMSNEAGRYKGLLSTEEIRYVENYCKEQMEYFDYGISDLEDDNWKDNEKSNIDGNKEWEEVLDGLDNNLSLAKNPGLTQVEKKIYPEMFKIVERIKSRKLYIRD